MAEVIIDRVTKRFGSVEAVRDVSLAVPSGELVVLLGPTGAGKTTLLRLVAGLEKPDAGIITIDARDATSEPPALRDVSFVFQQYSLYPHLTVYDNLAFPLRAPARRVDETEIRKRVTRVAELVRIDHKLANAATRLSGGEMQRVAIGRALVRRPAIYLMDEPLSSLDAKLRAELRVELKHIQADLGATMLYVTHDQTEAMTLGQRVAVLNHGVIQQVDTPQRLYRRPVNTFVASFIGSPPMNFVRGRLARGAIMLGEHRLELPDELRDAIRSDMVGSNSSDVLLGLRPEDFVDARLHAHSGYPVLPSEVEIAEQLGPETFIYSRVPGLDVVEIGERPVELAGALAARLDPRTTAEPGQQLMLAVDLRGAHLFDLDSGQSVLTR
jgi:multiple sugar transport system ATP-binding protein